MAKLFQVSVHHKRWLIKGQRSAVGIQDAATNRRYSHGAHGLSFLILHVYEGRGHLHIPETAKEQGRSQKQAGAHVVHAGISITLGFWAIHGNGCLAQYGWWCRKELPEVAPPRIDRAMRVAGKRALQKIRSPKSQQTIARE